MKADVFDTAMADPVADAQRHFRAVLAAMAEPGKVQHLTGVNAPAALPAALWGTLLALCDTDTAVWIDPALAGGELARSLALLTDCTITEDAGAATFAVVTPQSPIVDLGFNPGTRAWPERSTTLLVAVDAIEHTSSAGWQLRGPGIPGTRCLSIDADGSRAVTDELMRALTATRTDFPLGLDAVLARGDALVALPRSTRLIAPEGVSETTETC